MFPVTRFKFDNEKQATKAMVSLFGADEDGNLITNSENHSVSMIGIKEFYELNDKGEVVNTVKKEGFHVNVVTRESLDVTDNVIEPVTPWFKIQGEQLS